jgi:non-ribosomal peptide synthetase component F
VVLSHRLARAALEEAMAGPAQPPPVLDLQEDAPAWADQSAANPDPASLGLTPQHLAYVIYTSGSTGQPKGVMGTHLGTLNRIAWMLEAYPFVPGESCLQKTSVSFVDSVWEILGTLSSGAMLILKPQGESTDARSLTRLMLSARITRLVAVPSLLTTLVNLDFGQDVLRSVRVLRGDWRRSLARTAQSGCQRPHLPEPLWFIGSFGGRHLF